MEQQLIDAIRDLERAIGTLNGNLGRGINPGGGGGRGGRGGKPGGSSGGSSPTSPLDEAFKKTSKGAEKLAQVMLEQIAAMIAAGKKLTKEQQDFLKSVTDTTKAVEDGTKATKEKTQAEEEAAWKAKQLANANKEAIKGTGEFVKEMALGRGNLGQALGGLQGGLEMAGKAGNKFAAFAGIVVGALSFTLSTLQEFAKNAQGVAGAIDLRALRAGFYTSRMLYSGIGEQFAKVINDSENSFKFFGRTTEEAVDRLADLSRGLKSGSGQLSRSLKKELGADTVKAFDRAASAAAALGMTDEERASLQASIMTQVRMTAKNEVDAQRMLVDQYSKTVVSARELSNTFGISARALLKAIENFNRSTSGRTLARRGMAQEAQGMVASVESLFGDSLSQDQKERISGALAQGRTGDAVAVEGLNAAQRQAIQALGSAREQANQMQGGATAENLAKAMQEQGSLRRVADSYEGVREGVDQTGISRTREDINRFLSNLDPRVRQQAEQDAAKNAEANKTTEARNIESLNKLETAINSLKGWVSGLIVAIVANTGAIGLLATAMAGGALVKGLGGLLGGDGKGGFFKSAIEKIGIGGGTDVGSRRRRRAGIGGGRGGRGGAGGGSGGGVMDKIGSGIGSVGEGLGKGIAGIAGGIAEGVAKLLPAIGQGIAGFISAFGNPAVLKGALILAGVVAIIGGGVALAMAAIGLGLKAFAWGLKDVNEIDGDNLSKVSNGLKDLSLGMLAFSAVAGANILGAMANGLAGIFGADIVSRIKKTIEELAPIAPQLMVIGPAMKAYGEGLKFFAEAFNSMKGLGTGEIQKLFAVIKNSGLNPAELAVIGPAMKTYGEGLKFFGESFVMLKGVGTSEVEKLFAVIRNSGLDPKVMSVLGPAMRTYGEGFKFFAEAFSSLKAIGVGELEKLFAVIRDSGLNSLAALGTGMLNFGTGLKTFAEALKLINVDQLQKVIEILGKVPPENIKLLQTGNQYGGLTPKSQPAIMPEPVLDPARQLGTLLSQPGETKQSGLGNGPNSMFEGQDNPAAKEILTYLSNIATDINAIRGNTRPESSITPVRLG